MPRGPTGQHGAAASPALGRRFHLALVKPSHYDDDGYVIQWLRSAIPSNSLAVLHGLALDCAERQVLGPGTAITVASYDETNTRIRPDRIARDIKAAGTGLVALVGVQSNQYPRAMDIARRLRALGIQVCIGGFHVSGSLAMLPGITPELQEALDLGVSLYAGEAEEGLEGLLRDAAGGALKPVYNRMAQLPNLAGVPTPFLPPEQVRRTAGTITSFDAGRGCPFQCSFCTIINVQGRVSRRRTPDDVEAIVRRNLALGVRAFFITDDNFARNKDWEAILDRLILLREQEGLRCKLMVQVDTLCHRIPRFIEKCGRAGVNRVFIGLEAINPESLAAAKKKQNRITEYRDMMLAWKDIRATIYAGYIIGFPADTQASVLRDIRIIQEELPVDFLEFFVLTPLPGSEDHQKAVGGRRADGRRPEPLRHLPRRDRPSAHGPGGVGGDLLAGLAQLLLGRAHRDADAPRPRLRHEPGQDAVDADGLLGLEPGRARPSAGRRLCAVQAAGRPPARDAERACLALLAGLRRRPGGEACPHGADGGALLAAAPCAEARSGGARLHRPGADAGDGGGRARVGPVLSHRCGAGGRSETQEGAWTSRRLRPSRARRGRATPPRRRSAARCCSPAGCRPASPDGPGEGRMGR